LTAPYFHDASVDSLEDAIKTMAKYQLGKTISNQEVGEIELFLRTLTGELNGQALWHG
jgi:cytochrome c peroxidase